MRSNAVMADGELHPIYAIPDELIEKIHVHATTQAAGAEPAGYLFGNSYWDANNRRITDDIKRLGKPLYSAPQSAETAAVAFKFINGSKGWSVLPLDVQRWEKLPHGTKLFTAPSPPAQQALPDGWRVQRNEDGSIGLFAPPPPRDGESRPTSECFTGKLGNDMNEIVFKLLEAMLAAAPQLPKEQGE